MNVPSGWLSSVRARWGNGGRGATADAFADEALLLDERVLARLRRLSLAAGHARTEGLAGEHRSRRRGTSPEFADFKRYSHGDDFRRIDWNSYARLDGLFVRLSEVTTELSVHILLDSSASMDWRSSDERPTKFTAARRLAGALAYVALWGFDRVAIVPFADTVGPVFGPVQGRAQVVPMLSYLQRARPIGGTALGPAIANYAFGRRRPGLMLIVSDLLSGEPEDLKATLHDLRARGWQTSVLHVVDLAEISSDVTSSWLRSGSEGVAATSVELVDRESGATLRLAADEDVVRQYAMAVTDWLEGVEAACTSELAAYARVPSEWGIEDLTLALLYQRGVVA